MCHPPPAIEKPTKTKTRSCKWVYGAFTSRELLVNEQPAPLTITVGEETWYYHVHLLADGTYTLTHIHQDGRGFEDYHVRPDFMACTCPASKYRRQACKHVLALRAALKRLEANV